MNAQSKKKTALVVSIFLVISTLIGTISFIPTENNLSFSIIKTSQIISFLAAGIVYLLVLIRFNIFTDNDRQQNWMYTSFLTFFIFCALFFLYFVNDKFWPVIALSSSCAFFLPYIINQVWYSYNSIFRDISHVKFNTLTDLKAAPEAPERETKKPESIVHFKSSANNGFIPEPILLQNQQLPKVHKEEYEEKFKQQRIQFQQEKNEYEVNLKKEYDQLINQERTISKAQWNNELYQLLLEEKKLYADKIEKVQRHNQNELEEYKNNLKAKFEKIRSLEKEANEQEINHQLDEIKNNNKDDNDKLVAQHIKLQLQQRLADEANMKIEIEKTREQEKRIYKKQLSEDQLEVRQEEKQKYEVLKKQLEEQIKLQAKETEATLKSAIAKTKLEEKESYKKQLFNQQHINQREQEIFKAKFDRQQQDIEQKEKSNYENLLEQEEERIKQRENLQHQYELNKEVERVKQKEKEAFEKKIILEKEVLKQELDFKYKDQLSRELELIKQREKSFYENVLSKNKFETNQSEKDLFEKRLTEEITKIHLEKDSVVKKLKNENEEIIQKEKENYTTQLAKEANRISEEQNILRTQLQQKFDEEKEILNNNFEVKFKEEIEKIQFEKGVAIVKLKNENEEIIQKEKENYTTQLAKEANRISEEQSDYKTQLLQKFNEEKEILINDFESKLKSEKEKIQDEKNATIKSIKKEKDEIIEKEKENYTIQLAKEVDKILEKQSEYNKQLLQKFDEEKTILNNDFAKKLKEETEKILEKKDTTIKKLQSESEEIAQKQQENNATQLAEKVDKILKEQNILRMQLQQKFDKEKEILNKNFEGNLKDEKEKIYAETNVTIRNLKNENEEAIRKEKENYTTQLAKEEKLFKVHLQQKLDQEKDILIIDFAKNLKDEKEKIYAETNVIIEKLRNENKEVIQKEKENYTTQLTKEIDRISNDRNNYKTQLQQKFDYEKENLVKDFEKRIKEQHEEIQKENDIAVNNLQQQLQSQKNKTDVEDFADNPAKETDDISKDQVVERDEEIEPQLEFAEKKNKLFTTATTEVSQKNGTPWVYTTPEKEQTPFLFLDSVLVYIQISVRSYDESEQLFSMKVPLDMNLGNAFQHFMNINKKARIETYDGEGNFYSWKFYAKGFLQFGLSELSPYESLKKNKIKEGKTIIAMRIKN